MTPEAYAVPRATGPVLALVPVKSLELAKSRLALPGPQRRELALAFAADTLAALTRCAEVTAIVVVTGDADVAALAAAAGAALLPDEGDSLDAAIAGALPAALRALPAVLPGLPAVLPGIPAVRVLVTPADLPCLRPADVTDVLRQSEHVAAGARSARAARGGATFVPDRAGTGTTMVIHPASEPVVTGYGPGSAARHTALGLTPLAVAPVRARHDVDTLADLHAAVELGLGPRTAALVAEGLDLTALLRLPTR